MHNSVCVHKEQVCIWNDLNKITITCIKKLMPSHLCMGLPLVISTDNLSATAYKSMHFMLAIIASYEEITMVVQRAN